MTTTTTLPTPTALEAATQLGHAILGKRQARLEQRANEPPWKPRRHYASNLNGCARNLAYAVTHYQERETFTPEVVATLEDGTHEERLLIQELLADGFDVVEQQVQLDDDRYWVTGKIDGKIRWLGRRVPFEVKRLNPYSFEQVETLDDVRRNEFLLKKLRQLTLYLFLHNEEAGLFIFSDGLGGRKVLPVPLDLGLAEAILQDLDAANAALRRIEGGVPEAEALPARIPYAYKVCGYCPFRRTCLPDVDFGAGVVLGDAELAAAVERYVALKPGASEYERLKKEIAATVKDKPLVLVGTRVISGRWVERVVKATDSRVDRFWRWDIEQGPTHA